MLPPKARYFSPLGGAPANVAIAAARLGAEAEALACTDYGVVRALPTREELERFMAVRG